MLVSIRTYSKPKTGHRPNKAKRNLNCSGGLDAVGVKCLVTVNKRFVMARKMFHPVHEMSKVFNGSGNGNGAGFLKTFQ